MYFGDKTMSDITERGALLRAYLPSNPTILVWIPLTFNLFLNLI